MSPAADGGNRAGLPRPALFVIDNDPGAVHLSHEYLSAITHAERAAS